MLRFLAITLLFFLLFVEHLSLSLSRPAAGLQLWSSDVARRVSAFSFGVWSLLKVARSSLGAVADLSKSRCFLTLNKPRRKTSSSLPAPMPPIEPPGAPSSSTALTPAPAPAFDLAAKIEELMDEEGFDLEFDEDVLQSSAARDLAESMLKECSVKAGDDDDDDEEDDIKTAQADTGEVEVRAAEKRSIDNAVNCGEAVDSESFRPQVEALVDEGMLPEDAEFEAALGSEDVLGNVAPLPSTPAKSSADEFGSKFSSLRRCPHTCFVSP